MPAPALSTHRVAGDLVFMSGVVPPRDPATGQATLDVAGQTRAVLTTLQKNLAAAGCSLADVQRVGAYLGDLDEDFAAFDAVYREFFAEPFPARTTIGATLRGVSVEIDAVAVRPAGPAS
jgi:2-iminobutanoate/2-iminopropanoate deaminase